ncbi:hypothetical protein BsIDN1_23230 [Bacillus safensis]|uniref:Uncharacterized protein n=1 Tax=Bacillus safensis TaxID=561879 RepID=A0A5S9M791_BACIA|nr:hypothetical protein BsIDN1_23230 [Bacillus safensis]
MISDRNTDYQMYQSGDLDTAFVPAEQSENLLKNKDVQIEDQAGLFFLSSECEHGTFSK